MSQLHAYLSKQVLFLLGENSSYWASSLGYVCSLLILAAAGFLVYYVSRISVLRVVRHAFEKSGSLFLHTIADNKALSLTAPLAGAIIFYLGSDFVDIHDQIQPLLHTVVRDITIFSIFLLIILTINRIIWSINTYYDQKFTVAAQYPIYSYLQVLMLAVWVVGIIFIIAFFAHTSPLALLTGVGAVSAVFLLVFRDTLLGIVASIQVTASNMVRIGDEICISKYSIDGVVTDIRINNVKVRNEDNTVVTIPTYYLTSEVVKNWRGVREAGSWLIKRAINLDMKTIKLCDATLLTELAKLPAIATYLQQCTDADEPTVNLTLYREYINHYLAKHPHIAHRCTTMVRHLAPTVNGLPLEIYTYVNYTTFAQYEGIQAEIFEHCLIMLGCFELSVLQTTV